MTILSYVATAVISAKTAIEYLFKFVEKLLEVWQVHYNIERFVIPGVIIILFLFALLVISGVKDSAKVAAAIFVFHIIIPASFIVIGIITFDGFAVFQSNWNSTQKLIIEQRGLLPTLFLAFSASLLGVSGFESSANFVEEQERGVFKKTLKNMLLGVMIFNPLIALVVLNILPLDEIAVAKDFLLASAAYNIGGLFILGWIAINAFLVLCGAVLTSYVGVSGLINRMALDDTLPTFLLKENSKGSHPRIIFAFFLLCTSILLITKGELLSLAGVYTISFLGVMTLFALGNLILRETRTELKRSYRAPILFVFVALFATLFGMIGNSIIDFHNDIYFLIYFTPAIFIVYSIIYKKDILKAALRAFKNVGIIRKWLARIYEETKNARFYVFVHHVDRLYEIMNYIAKNENGWKITIVHCKNGDKGQMAKIKKMIPLLKMAGVYP